MDLREACSEALELDVVSAALERLKDGQGLVLGERTYFEDLNVDVVHWVAVHEGRPSFFTYQPWLGRKLNLEFMPCLSDTAKGIPYDRKIDPNQLLEDVVGICEEFDPYVVGLR